MPACDPTFIQNEEHVCLVAEPRPQRAKERYPRNRPMTEGDPIPVMLCSETKKIKAKLFSDMWRSPNREPRRRGSNPHDIWCQLSTQTATRPRHLLQPSPSTSLSMPARTRALSPPPRSLFFDFFFCFLSLIFLFSICVVLRCPVLLCVAFLAGWLASFVRGDNTLLEKSKVTFMSKSRNRGIPLSPSRTRPTAARPRCRRAGRTSRLESGRCFPRATVAARTVRWNLRNALTDLVVEVCVGCTSEWGRDAEERVRGRGRKGNVLVDRILEEGWDATACVRVWGSGALKVQGARVVWI